VHKRRTILGASDHKEQHLPRLFSLPPRLPTPRPGGSYGLKQLGSTRHDLRTRAHCRTTSSTAVMPDVLEGNIIAPECRGIQGRKCNGSTKLHLRSNWADLCSRLHYPPVKISLVSAWQVKTGAEAPFSCRQEPSQAPCCSPGRCRERSFPFLITLHRWLPRAVGAEGLARKIRLSMLDPA